MEVAIVLILITLTILAPLTLGNVLLARSIRRLRRDLINSGVITPHHDQSGSTPMRPQIQPTQSVESQK